MTIQPETPCPGCGNPVRHTPIFRPRHCSIECLFLGSMKKTEHVPQKMVSVTILVPLDDIEITGDVWSEKEYTDSDGQQFPASEEANVDISIPGLSYGIDDYDTQIIEEKAIENWKNNED